jgi:hypothetical protein
VTLIQNYGNSPIILSFLTQYYQDSFIAIKTLQQLYGNAVLQAALLKELYHLQGSIQVLLKQGYNISELIPVAILIQRFSMDLRDLTWQSLVQKWALISNNVIYDDPVIAQQNANTVALIETQQQQQETLATLIQSGGTPQEIQDTQDAIALTQSQIESIIVATNDLLPTANSVSYSIYVNEVRVSSENLNVECTDESYYIQASFSIEDPNYFDICTKNAPVRIEIITPTDSKTYHLLLSSKSKRTSKSSIVYQIECKSKTYLLDSKFVPNLQKEFDEITASDVVREMAAIAGISVIWNVYHDGILVDQTIPAGYLFANNEKPLAVIRKITEFIGAIIQTTPEGDLEILHKYPIKVPDWETTSEVIVLNSAVKYETISSTEEERLGINTVNVSDQLTSDSTYSLEEEDVSETVKIIKGFHTPWGTEDVYLDTSGNSPSISDVFVEYLGIVDEDVPNDPDNPMEIVEFIGGLGKTSKPIYSINSRSWLRNPLGSVERKESGELTSEVAGESLLEISYKTRYYKWRVTSPVLKNVQFILRPVNG